MKVRGFTLIELLVVIGIIAILASILFPVFARAKESAKKTACLSNTRQMGVGLYMYLNDFDDTLPMANYDNAYSGPGSKFSFLGGGHAVPCWGDLIQPYAKSFQIFKCPDDSSGPFINAGNPVPGEPLSYALNYYFYRTPDGFFGGTKGPDMSQIKEPSKKLFIVESASNLSREIVSPASNRSAGMYRHLDGGNYVYADTHARYHKAPKEWITISNTTWGNPALAALTGYNQWFFWIEGEENW